MPTQTAIRFSTDEKKRYEARARAAGITFSEWMRRAAGFRADHEERLEVEEAVQALYSRVFPEKGTNP